MNFGSVIPMNQQTTSLQTSENQSMTGIENQQLETPSGSVASTTPTLHSSTSTNTGAMGPFPVYLNDPLGLNTSAQGFFPTSSTLGSPQPSTGMIQGNFQGFQHPQYAGTTNQSFHPSMMVNPHAQTFPMGSGFGYSPSLAHLQQQYTLGSATMPNQGLHNNPWTFNEGLCAVLHAHGTCPQCDTLATHLSFGLISDDKTYKDAFAQRIDFIRQTMPVDDRAEESKLTLHERIGELNAQRTLERQDHERLLEDYNQVRDNLERVRTERNQAEKDRDNYIASVEALQGDVERLQERVRELEAQSPEYESLALGRKRKQMGDVPIDEAIPETPTSPPMSYNGLDDDMYDFDNDSVKFVTQPVVPSGTTVERIERLPCEPEDLEAGGY